MLSIDVACNDNQLQISEVSQLRDSCVYVTLQYEGHGEYYVINRAGNNHPVDAMNIIREGIYFGSVSFVVSSQCRHGKEGVSTVICNVYEKSEYTLYATVG